MSQFLHDHKIYLSRGEIETFMTVIADEGTQSADYVTPDVLRRAILKSKRDTHQESMIDTSSPRKSMTPRVK